MQEPCKHAASTETSLLLQAEALAQAQAQAQQEPQPPKNFAELYSQEFREVNVSDDAPEQPGEQPQRQGSAQSLPSGSAPPPVNLAAPMPRRSSSFFNPFADTAQVSSPAQPAARGARSQPQAACLPCSRRRQAAPASLQQQWPPVVFRSSASS